MAQELTPKEKLAKLDAEYFNEKAKLQKTVLDELVRDLEKAEAEVARIREEIKEITGSAPVGTKATRRPRLGPLEEGSDEWNKIAGQIKLVLKNYKDGLNAKKIAYKMGITDPKAAKRIVPVIQAVCQRQGKGVATRYLI